MSPEQAYILIEGTGQLVLTFVVGIAAIVAVKKIFL